MMIKSWRPSYESILSELDLLKSTIEDLPFNSEFSYQMQLIKLRLHELNERIIETEEIVKGEHAVAYLTLREMYTEMKEEKAGLLKRLAELRILRAARSRANYLHVQSLKERDNNPESENV